MKTQKYQRHMRLSLEWNAKLNDALKARLITNKQFVLIHSLMTLPGHPVGSTLMVSRKRIIGLVGLSEFQRFDAKRELGGLINQEFLKRITRSDGIYYLINPRFVFNGSIRDQESAVEAYDRGLFWGVIIEKPEIS